MFVTALLLLITVGGPIAGIGVATKEKKPKPTRKTGDDVYTRIVTRGGTRYNLHFHQPRVRYYD